MLLMSTGNIKIFWRSLTLSILWDGVTIMTIINERYKGRISRSYEKIRDAYNHKEKGDIPVLIMDIPYWVSVMSAEEIPEKYFTDVKTMFDFQVKSIEKHMSRIDDDYIPALFPWYGTGVVPSALGCKISFQDKMDPAIESTVISEPEDIKKLEMPDPYKDGLMPRVLDCIDYMRINSDLPVSFTDCQGPLNIALSLTGVENLFVWMYEHPEHVHRLMDFCTEVLIEWIKVQKKHADQKLNTGAFPHMITLPEGFGGVYLCDDDCTVLSPKLYEEFVVPYNSRVFKAFGGGTLHFCGNAEHQLENFLKTEGITGINNFCMGNFKQIAKMQELYEDKLALMVCDFTPLYIEKYYTELFSFIKNKGTIIATFVAPELALCDGKYEFISRNSVEMAEKSREIINRLIGEKN